MTDTTSDDRRFLLLQLQFECSRDQEPNQAAQDNTEAQKGRRLAPELREAFEKQLQAQPTTSIGLRRRLVRFPVRK